MLWTYALAINIFSIQNVWTNYLVSTNKQGIRVYNIYLRKRIFLSDVDVEWKTFEEETSLLLAARGGHFACCRALIGYSANVNTTTKENFAPLWEGN